MSGLGEEIQARKDDLEKIVIPPETTREQISAAESEVEHLEQENAQIRQAMRYRAKVKESQKFQKESDALTQKIERIQQDKSTHVANAKFPVEGLSIGDDVVLFNGIPFTQLSTGQQIRVSTGIAMALNPKARLIFIREGSLIDTEGFKAISDMATDKDYQLFVERVDETGNVGVFIENGEITAVDGKPVEKTTEGNDAT